MEQFINTREPIVHWSVEAQSQLEPVASPTSRKVTLEQALQATFPLAQTILVLKLNFGYRDYENRFILLVDVEQERRPGRYVVKVGLGEQAQEVRAECNAWTQCWPPTVRHDPVLMPLVAGYDGLGVSSLIYGDAQQFIRPATRQPQSEPKPLEEAVLSCVLSGEPSISSVCELLFQLYERMACLLYSDARTRPDSASASPQDPHFCMRRVWESMQLWHADEGPKRLSHECYRTVWEVRSTNDKSTEAASKYLDPVSYLEFVKRFTKWQVPRREVTGRRKDAGLEILEPKDNWPGSMDRLIPSFRRGRSHGDLHGRNVLVGEIDGRVLWPAVFDYEHMSRDNWIGWDFVKMETELKIRALCKIFPDLALVRFANYVQEFEWQLNLWTQHCDDRHSWPRVCDLPRSSPPEDRHPKAGLSPEACCHETAETVRSPTTEHRLCRLRAVLLQIRQRAAHILGYRCSRSAEWWREYQFLLMCYGVCSVRFENLDKFLLMAAFKSASVAAWSLSRSLPVQGPSAHVASIQV